MTRVFVLRIVENLGRRALLDDLAFCHDADAVGDAPHDAEIMRNEQHRHVVGGLQIGEQFQDLRLDRSRRAPWVGRRRSKAPAGWPSDMAIITRWR